MNNILLVPEKQILNPIRNLFSPVDQRRNTTPAICNRKQPLVALSLPFPLVIVLKLCWRRLGVLACSARPMTRVSPAFVANDMSLSSGASTSTSQIVQ
jgi:hypothetical protein